MRPRTLMASIAAVLMFAATPQPIGFAADEIATPAAIIPASTGEPMREVLISSHPAEAPDRVFELIRVTVPADAVLPVHFHPGDELATILTGSLVYHVVSGGSALLNHPDGTSQTGDPGDTLVLNAGDSLREPAGMVHWAENVSGAPVIFLAASLFEEGVPASIPVEATPAT